MNAKTAAVSRIVASMVGSGFTITCAVRALFQVSRRQLHQLVRVVWTPAIADCPNANLGGIVGNSARPEISEEFLGVSFVGRVKKSGGKVYVTCKRAKPGFHAGVESRSGFDLGLPWHFGVPCALPRQSIGIKPRHVNGRVMVVSASSRPAAAAFLRSRTFRICTVNSSRTACCSSAVGSWILKSGITVWRVRVVAAVAKADAVAFAERRTWQTDG